MVSKKNKQEIQKLYDKVMHLFAGQRSQGIGAPNHTFIASKRERTKYDYKSKKRISLGCSKHFSHQLIRPYALSNSDVSYIAWDDIYIILSGAGNMPHMLQALGKLDMHFGDNGERIWIVPPFVCELQPEVSKIIDEMVLLGAEVLYDERSADAPLVCDTPREDPRTGIMTGISSPTIRYVSKEVDQDLVFVVLREKFLRECRLLWDKIIVPRGKNFSASGKIDSAISRCNKFANLLLLGRGELEVFEKRGKTAKWRAEALAKVIFPENLYDEEVERAYRSVKQLEEVCKLWERCCQDYWVKLAIDLGDLDDKDEHLDKRFEFLGHCFGVDTLLDGWKMGLSADDILCGGPGRGW